MELVFDSYRAMVLFTFTYTELGMILSGMGLSHNEVGSVQW